jgi:ankyrin repeat protein
LLDEPARRAIQVFVLSYGVRYWEAAFDEAGITALHNAASHGDLHGVLAAIHQGLDVNGRDEARWTPLLWVVDMGSVA